MDPPCHASAGDDGTNIYRNLRRVLWPSGFAYSVLTRLTDGAVGCLFEADNYGRIVFARFPSGVAGGRLAQVVHKGAEVSPSSPAERGGGPGRVGVRASAKTNFSVITRA